MKKILLNVIACAAVLFSLTSCGPDRGPKEIKVIDYRNKSISGALVRSAVTANVSGDFTPDPNFSWKLLDTLNPFDGEIGYSQCTYKNEDGVTIHCFPDECRIEDADWSIVECEKDYYKIMSDAISFKDDPDGIKLVFTKPADYDNVTWIVFQYVDGNGNRSTLIDRNDWNSFFENGDFEFVYPLVVKDQVANFWVMLGNGDDSQPGVSFFYEVTACHGLGVVDDMPKKYKETDYISIDNGNIVHIKKTIPPYAKNVVRKFDLCEQNGGTYAWKDGPVNKLGTYLEESPIEAYTASENDEEFEFTLNLSDKVIEEYNGEENGFGKNLYQNNSHIFATFIYKYEMIDEKYDGYFFQTPEIKSKPVANTLFRTDLTE